MAIDLERLKHDREYWNELAPEGATHYVLDDCLPWEKREDGKTYVDVDGRWNYTTYCCEDSHYILNPGATTCPGCGGEPDNGFDRSLPPIPYYCTKCSEE